jgi:hypothetical protein
MASSVAVAGAAATGGAVLWPHRHYLMDRFRHKSLALPDVALPACEPGALDPVAVNRLWSYYESLGVGLGISSGSRESLAAVLELKTTQAPSYLRAYQDFLAQWPERESAMALTTRLVAGIGTAVPAQQQALRYVVKEFIALQYAQGGFKQLGIINVSGYPGMDPGYRLSRREKA